MSNVILISYDNGSHIPFFPLNLFYLTGALTEKGHEVKIIYQDIHHFPDSEITHYIDKFTFKNGGLCDVVGLGFCAGYYQYEKAKKISEAISFSKRRKDFIFVLGGHGPAGSPDFMRRKLKADTIIIGDGEEAICSWIEERKNGVIYGKQTIQDSSPLWLYPHFPIDLYRLIRWPTSNRTDFCFPILSSRGCIWHCSFCFRMREGFHERDIGSIMAEIKYLNKNFGINHFQFADELLMSSVKRTEAVCEAILQLPFKIKWDCNGRLNFATSTLMSIMKTAGCEYVNYGIESLDQKILNQMGKGLTLNRIHTGVEATLTAGLSPGLNLLWGFPGDTEQNLEEEVKFLKKYDPCHELRTIRPVTPYPNCPLYQKGVEDGLIKNAEDFYENLHKNSDLISVNFMDIPTDEAHRMLWMANEELVHNYYAKMMLRIGKQSDRLYLHGDTTFRGWRPV